MTDIVYALRVLKKAPGFTVVALLTFALGIGANSAIFSVVYGVLMRPLAYHDSGRLVFVWSSRTAIPREPLSPGRLIDFRQQLTSVEALAGISQIPLNLTGSGEPERLDASSVSSNFFDILGVASLLGEPFHGGTAQAEAVVLSYGLWVRRFGADRGIVGRHITLNGSSRAVVAVMPREFDWPMITGTPGSLNGPQLWIPGTTGDVPRTPRDRSDLDLSTNREAEYIRAVGRLRADVTVEQAQREAEIVAARIGQVHPDTDGSSRGRRGAAADAVLRSPATAAVGARGRRGSRAGDRLRERRQPASWTGRVSPEGNGDPPGARREPWSSHPAASDRIDDVGDHRRSLRTPAFVVDPVCADRFQPG